MIKNLMFFSGLLAAGLTFNAADEAEKAEPAIEPTTATADSDDHIRMAVISDVHIMAPSLLIQDGKALDDYIANDRKLLREGPTLVREAIDSILTFQPQILLISGDLTKDGETVSHLFVRDSLLEPLRKNGLKIFVVPGNHDINNPHAVEFDGDRTRRVPTPSAEEFAQIWSDYGYGNSIARDTESLSYVAQLDSKTRLLALDACLYNDNDFLKDSCVTAGRLQKATFKFIKEQLRDARENDQKVIAMIHHGVVEHWRYQKLIMGEYITKGNRKLERMLSRGGVDLVFTGHFHANDISEGRHGLYDVETGSLVSYPAPVRFVTVDRTPEGSTRYEIQTAFLKGEGLTFPSGNDFQQEMLEYAEGAIRWVIDSFIPGKVTPEVKELACKVISKAYAVHLYGDETVTPEVQAELDKAVSELKKESRLMATLLKMVGNSFYHDKGPADLHLVIER